MIDGLYVAFNRLAMTEASFAALIDNTDWDEVGTLYVRDDGSTDGTAEWLQDHLADVPARTVFNGDTLGGPVASMNWYLDASDPETDRFFKIDNDFVVCPGWLEETLRMMYLNPGVDIFGMEPMHGPPVMGMEPTRRLNEARWIGGKGIIRRRVFDICRPTPSGFNGYSGFTEWQSAHPQIEKAWIYPDMPCFGLDQLPFEPWVSLTDEYERVRWQRRWPAYPEAFSAYWDWWLKASVPAVEAG